MGFTTTRAQSVLKDLFNSGYYIGLSTTTPTADGDNVTEPEASAGYARSAVSGGSFAMTSTTSRTITNGAYVYFPEASADWGTVTHMLVYAAKTGGTPIYFGALTPSSGVKVESDHVPLFKPNTINISLDSD